MPFPNEPPRRNSHIFCMSRLRGAGRLAASAGVAGLIYLSPWLDLSKASLVRLGLLSPSSTTPKRIASTTKPLDVLVIVPTYRESAGALLETLRRIDVAAERPERVRIVLANGGPADDLEVEKVVREFQPQRLSAFEWIHVASASPGRGATLNAGAQHRAETRAKDELLVFCHADVMMPMGFDKDLDQTFELSDNPPLVTAFTFKIRCPDGRYAFVERTTNWRSRWLDFPYGDQTLCVRREDFDRLGGFPDMRIMEDFEFVRRARREAWSRGTRVATIAPSVEASARRWEAKGVLVTTLWNWWICASYMWFGVSPDVIFKWYYGR